jgi:hypothetical protein
MLFLSLGSGTLRFFWYSLLLGFNQKYGLLTKSVNYGIIVNKQTNNLGYFKIIRCIRSGIYITFSAYRKLVSGGRNDIKLSLGNGAKLAKVLANTSYRSGGCKQVLGQGAKEAGQATINTIQPLTPPEKDYAPPTPKRCKQLA